MDKLKFYSLVVAVVQVVAALIMVKHLLVATVVRQNFAFFH
jgi:hypothetical protein